VTASVPSLFAHALAWTLFHIFGLGLLLKAQSERKFLVRHFLTHYHYPANDINIGAVREAFANWKGMYNLSMCMTYGGSFIFRLYSWSWK
jgi:phosphatidylethanolamine N-methyltransferase